MKYIYPPKIPSGYYIYVYLYPDTNIPFYIGKGQGRRYIKHLYENKKNTENYKKWAVIEGLRRKQKSPIVIILESNLNEDIAYDIETKLIKLFGRQDIDQGGILTNILLDGKPPHNPWTEERREKARIRATNRKITDQTREKCRQANLGRKHSDITKENMSNAAKIRMKKYGNPMSGKKHSEKTIQKLKEKAKNRIIAKKQCVHCNQWIDPGNFARLHGEKCKMKKY